MKNICRALSERRKRGNHLKQQSDFGTCRLPADPSPYFSGKINPALLQKMARTPMGRLASQT